MKQFILEEQFEVICDDDGRVYADVAEIEKEEFIEVKSGIHRAYSSRKFGLKFEKCLCAIRGRFQSLDVKIFVSCHKPEILFMLFPLI